MQQILRDLFFFQSWEIFREMVDNSAIFWHKITILIPVDYELPVSKLLLKLAPQGIWPEAEGVDRLRVNAFLPGSISQLEIEDALKKALVVLMPSVSYQIIVVRVQEEVWQTAWQRHSVPIQTIGKTLEIIPPWEKKRLVVSNRRVICLSPGMAFGTGTHATTHNCLLFLENLIENGLEGPMLDVGTGSGILAIAAAKLGLQRITATEIDPVALRIAKKNASENRVISKINFRASIPIGRRYACVVANLTTSVLLELHEVLFQAVLPGGTLILSGMMKEGHEIVLDVYQVSFFLLERREKEGWVTLLMKRK